jgi:hypothetical protein
MYKVENMVAIYCKRHHSEVTTRWCRSQYTSLYFFLILYFIEGSGGA